MLGPEVLVLFLIRRPKGMGERYEARGEMRGCRREAKAKAKMEMEMEIEMGWDWKRKWRKTSEACDVPRQMQTVGTRTGTRGRWRRIRWSTRKEVSPNRIDFPGCM